jgi:hypothetical protein
MKIAPQTYREQGNALFLILIAVVLFAALAYAITQSNRSGADPSRETNLITSTTVTQYPASLSTAITRMLLRGVSVAQLDFDSPSSGTFNTAPTNLKVFHPNGGGMSFQNVDPNTVELDSNGAPLGQWAFVRTSIRDVGLNGSEDGVEDDIVAVLTDMRKGVCERINEQITGSIDIPDNSSPGVSSGDLITLVGGPDKLGVNGKPFMCVRYDPGGSGNYQYAYYHVLVEQ